MSRRGWMFIVAAMFLSLVATSASGEGGTGGISLSAGLTPMGGGDAGSGYAGSGGGGTPYYVTYAPAYYDAYDTGWTGRIEPYYDFHPLIRGQVGVAYNEWSGNTAGGIRFGDLKVTTYYIGGKNPVSPELQYPPLRGRRHRRRQNLRSQSFLRGCSGLISILEQHHHAIS
jgi:hypothetical protein